MDPVKELDLSLTQVSELIVGAYLLRTLKLLSG